MNKWLKVIVWLGAMPLVFGIGILVAWTLSCANWLGATGIITIYGGIAFGALGFAGLCQMNRWLKAALLLGIVPLAIGIAVFATWMITRADWLMGAGMITICVGIANVAMGLVCLCVYLWQARRASLSWQNLAWRVTLVLAVYVAGFLAAGRVAVEAVRMSSPYTVTIVNRSSLALESAQMEGGGVNVEIGMVPPYETVRSEFRIKQDGELILTARQGDRSIRLTIEAYVTSRTTSKMVVTIEPAGAITVTRRS